MNEAPIKWYVKSDGGEAGPYSSMQLKSLAKNGKIDQRSLLRNQSSEWTPASKVRGLFALGTGDSSPPELIGGTQSENSVLRRTAPENDTPMRTRTDVAKKLIPAWSIAVPVWLVAITCLIVLIAGFFAGRYHQRSQLRNDVGLFVESLKGSSSGSDRSIPNEVSVKSQAERDLDLERSRYGSLVKFGESCVRETYTVNLVNAEVSHPKVRTREGVQLSNDKALLVKYEIVNTTDRMAIKRIAKLSVIDDVGNELNEKKPDFLETFIDDEPAFSLSPGESAIISQVLDAPLPKTKSLTIRLDLLPRTMVYVKEDCDLQITYIIDAALIQGFSGSK